MLSVATHILAARLFLDPLKVWDYWPLLLLPLVFGVSLVYKSVRVETMRQLPKEAVKATCWIVVGMIVAAGVLTIVVRFVSSSS